MGVFRATQAGGLLLGCGVVGIGSKSLDTCGGTFMMCGGMLWGESCVGWVVWCLCPCPGYILLCSCGCVGGILVFLQSMSLWLGVVGNACVVY